MNRHHYDRPGLHAAFRAQHNALASTLGAIGAVAHTVGAVKHAVDVVQGKAPSHHHLHIPSFSPALSARLGALNAWRDSRMAKFAHRMAHKPKHIHRDRTPALAMSAHRHGR